jgi:hypothetical protein
MKNFKKSAVLGLTIISAILVTGCGRQEGNDVPVNSSTLNNPVVNPPTNNGGVITNPNPTPTPTPTPTSTVVANRGCSSSAPGGAPYSGYASGTGPYSSGSLGVSLDRQIIADRTLRVSLTPQSGNPSYNTMGVKVNLLRNGTIVASQPIQLTSGSYSYGTQVGVTSDPMIADFSNAKTGLRFDDGANYTVSVSEVKTNWTCKTYCTANYYSCYTTNFCTGRWTWDFNTGNTYCCPGTGLQSCQTLNCGLALVTSSQTWSLRLQVETDNTRCIGQ